MKNKIHNITKITFFCVFIASVLSFSGCVGGGIQHNQKIKEPYSKQRLRVLELVELQQMMDTLLP